MNINSHISQHYTTKKGLPNLNSEETNFLPVLANLTEHSANGTLLKSPASLIHRVIAVGSPLVFIISTIHSASSMVPMYWKRKSFIISFPGREEEFHGSHHRNDFLHKRDALCINLCKDCKFLTFLFCAKCCYHLALLYKCNWKEFFVRKHLSKILRSNIGQA